MNLNSSEKFAGQIKKITIVSTPCFFSEPLVCDTDAEQKLTINSSGRVTYTSKLYAFHSFSSMSEGRWRKQNLFKESAEELLNTIIEPFRNYEIRPHYADTGLWHLIAYNTDGKKFQYDGCLYPESFDRAEEISYFVRNMLNMQDLYVFDGQRGFHSEKYIYLSVEFSSGGKTYYYQTKDNTIKCGDRVLVTVGDYGEKIVKVVKVEVFGEYEVPMPVDEVKSVVGKITKDMEYSKYDIIEAHKYSLNNASMLRKDKRCACFYCCSIYEPKIIEEYIDDEDETKEDATALCPICGIDSVIPESAGYPLTEEFLKSMHRCWFGNDL